jgi:hypothetical protein
MNSRNHFYPDLLIHLRYIFNELAWTQQLPELAHLIRRQDVPRRPRRLPRPLTAQQDQLLQQEFLRRNDLGGNAFLLIRHTGMRIGECASVVRLSPLHRPQSMGGSCTARQTADRTHGPGRFVCLYTRPAPTILSLPRSVAR